MVDGFGLYQERMQMVTPYNSLQPLQSLHPYLLGERHILKVKVVKDAKIAINMRLFLLQSYGSVLCPNI